jgi:NDP-4-keto-2,6-dideoxyhexose 3-C-methyltransferase
MYSEISRCRICGNSNLESVIDLGQQCLTGIFPRSKAEKVSSGPLELVKCMEGDSEKFCGLVQLRHSYDKYEMYGDNYGYRSGLNSSMVAHLKDVANKNCKFANLNTGDLIIDIGSNDGTLLKLYPKNNYLLVGIDPTVEKFRRFYPSNIKIIPDFFSSQIVKDNFGNKRAKAVSSIAMFYDLESPLDFVQQVYEILDDDGIWVLEQSYMPLMLKRNAYDTICHEHLEYYSLRQVKWMLDKVGFKILDLEFNDINGGSFKLIVAKRAFPKKERSDLVAETLNNERKSHLYTLRPFEGFRNRIGQHRDQLLSTIGEINKRGEKVLGYGASTKGNVILQYCGFTEKDIPYIAEVNEDKFGSYTPGTYIPIIPEKEAKTINPNYFLVLPWHFKENFLNREREYLKAGGKFIFPLPEIEVISYRDID